MSTYDRVAGAQGPSFALDLYEWNARVSAALLAPMHICEVIVRNAVSEAIEHQYGENWPWSSGFHRSLPDPKTTFNPRIDLCRSRKDMTTTGKVIPELKFVFWQTMFTSRHDRRIWTASFRRVFPNTEKEKSIAALRLELYGDMEQLRLLRNRIAHHEPIISRNLQADLERIYRLVGYASMLAETWLRRFDSTNELIATRPEPS